LQPQPEEGATAGGGDGAQEATAMQVRSIYIE
jgi:hypothetical protein